MKFKIGIDVGGTFTDLFLWSDEGVVRTFKTLSTPEDPSIGFVNGLQQIADAYGMGLADLVSRITNIVHGTTVTTNATLTRLRVATDMWQGTLCWMSSHMVGTVQNANVFLAGSTSLSALSPIWVEDSRIVAFWGSRGHCQG